MFPGLHYMSQASPISHLSGLASGRFGAPVPSVPQYHISDVLIFSKDDVEYGDPGEIDTEVCLGSYLKKDPFSY